MKKRKLLSIVVPTKDRYKYLKFLIDLVANFHSDEVELVIQDNSKDNVDFIEYLKSLQYGFIRYDHVQGQIPMSVNSDKAILNSTGEYVCFLGDDDGLTKTTIEYVKWMKHNNIEALNSASIFYFWPDYSNKSLLKRSSSIRYRRFSNNVTYTDPYKELLKVLRNGINEMGNMPKVYHAIVSREALDRVYEKCGTYFPGNSPDISNAVALSLTVKKCAKINLPLVFSGWSVYAGGGVYANGRKGEPSITEVPWFRPNVEENWNHKLPRLASPFLIWADSAMWTLKQMGREDLYEKVNFNKLYANFVVAYPTYRNKLNNLSFNRFLFIIFSVCVFIKRYFTAAIRRLELFFGIVKIKNGVNNIIEASSFLDKIHQKQ